MFMIYVLFLNNIFNRIYLLICENVYKYIFLYDEMYFIFDNYICVFFCKIRGYNFSKNYE